MIDRDLVKAFVEYLRGQGFPDLRIDIWPDDENRNSPEIDAVAGDLSIECTSVDTIPNQRRDSERFFKVFGNIAQELPFRVTFRMNITVEYGAVKKGQPWATIHEGIKDWIIREARNLPEGHHVINGVPNVPFRLDVRKMNRRRPGIIVARFAPEDDSLPIRIRNLFDGKIEKLSKYKKIGKTTVLLLDGWDFVLMNEWIMLNGIEDAYPNGLPQGLDQIWYADTSTPTDVEFTNLTTEFRDQAGGGRTKPCY